MKYWLLLCLFWFFGPGATAQTAVGWSLLSEVQYTNQRDIESGHVIQRPRFSEGIKALEGQVIEIKGYLIPMDAEGKTYAISRYPYAACFFCGGAGQESVMTIWFADQHQRYRLDQYITLRGILRLNDNGEGLMYLLEEAEEVK